MKQNVVLGNGLVKRICLLLNLSNVWDHTSKIVISFSRITGVIDLDK